MLLVQVDAFKRVEEISSGRVFNLKTSGGQKKIRLPHNWIKLAIVHPLCGNVRCQIVFVSSTRPD